MLFDILLFKNASEILMIVRNKTKEIRKMSPTFDILIILVDD